MSVVIPVFNEKESVGAVIRRVLTEVPIELEIVVVNDGSTDGTAEVLDQVAKEDARIRVVHQRNAGKTAALKQAFQFTRGDIVIIQDADLEYDPAEIIHVIEPILSGRAHVVYGSRFLVRRAARVLFYYHYLANHFITFISNMLTNLNMTDVETGYKAFRGDLIRNMEIQSRGFGFEIEVTAKVARLRVPVYEVPISYYGRTYSEGKKIGLWDGIHAIWYVFRFNLFK